MTQSEAIAFNRRMDAVPWGSAWAFLDGIRAVYADEFRAVDVWMRARRMNQ